MDAEFEQFVMKAGNAATRVWAAHPPDQISHFLWGPEQPKARAIATRTAGLQQKWYRRNPHIRSRLDSGILTGFSLLVGTRNWGKYIV